MEVFTPEVLSFIISSDKLGVVAILILVVFGLAGFNMYLIKNLNTSISQVAKNIERTNELYTQSLNFHKDFINDLKGSLQEIKSQNSEILDCCKEVKLVNRYIRHIDDSANG